MKTCTGCRQQLPLDQFGPSKRNAGGIRTKCFECRAAYRRSLYASRADIRLRSADRARMRNYGLTSQQFNDMLEAQQGKCAICRDALIPGKQTHVDHDHKTGKVRALLCHPCNLAVGYIEPRPHLLSAYSAYLNKHA